VWIVLLIALFGFILIAKAVLEPLFANAHAASTMTTCLFNLSSLSRGVSMYAGDHDDLVRRHGNGSFASFANGYSRLDYRNAPIKSRWNPLKTRWKIKK